MYIFSGGHVAKYTTIAKAVLLGAYKFANQASKCISSSVRFHGNRYKFANQASKCISFFVHFHGHRYKFAESGQASVVLFGPG